MKLYFIMKNSNLFMDFWKNEIIIEEIKVFEFIRIQKLFNFINY
jgi:hypothetical protein